MIVEVEDTNAAAAASSESSTGPATSEQRQRRSLSADPTKDILSIDSGFSDKSSLACSPETESKDTDLVNPL